MELVVKVTQEEVTHLNTVTKALIDLGMVKQKKPFKFVQNADGELEVKTYLNVCWSDGKRFKLVEDDTIHGEEAIGLAVGIITVAGALDLDDSDRFLDMVYTIISKW